MPDKTGLNLKIVLRGEIVHNGQVSSLVSLTSDNIWEVKLERLTVEWMTYNYGRTQQPATKCIINGGVQCKFVV